MERIPPISRRSRLEPPRDAERVERRQPSEEERRRRQARQRKLAERSPERKDGDGDGRHIDVRA